MKDKKNDLTGPIVATIIVAFIMTGMLITFAKNRQPTAQGSKQVFIKVILSEEKTYDFKMYSDAEYLGEALKNSGFIKGEETEFGFYVTEVKGFAADSSKNEWWCITKGGEEIYTGVDQIPINDGDRFEFTLKTY